MRNPSYPHDTDKKPVALAYRDDGDEPMLVTPGGGTEGWIASFYQVGEPDHRRGVITTHNEMMVDRDSLDAFTFKWLKNMRVVEDVDKLARRLEETA